VLVAPTGRAAERLAELTGHEAATVHRLLQLQPGGEAKYDRDNPLDADLVVLDESSTIDLILANKLVKAVPRGAHLLLVGDVDQLPSVGAGEVLQEMLTPHEDSRPERRYGGAVICHNGNTSAPATRSLLADDHCLVKNHAPSMKNSEMLCFGKFLWVNRTSYSWRRPFDTGASWPLL
jgi:hypothetical protein